MTDVAEGPTRGRARVLGASGAALGVVVVLSSYVLAGGDSFGLLTAIVAGTAVACLVTLRLPSGDRPESESWSAWPARISGSWRSS